MGLLYPQGAQDIIGNMGSCNSTKALRSVGDWVKSTTRFDAYLPVDQAERWEHPVIGERRIRPGPGKLV